MPSVPHGTALPHVCRSGDPLLKADLMKVSVSSAATIIVLASEETASQSDARVLRIVLMLMSIHAQLVQATEEGFPVSRVCCAADCNPASTAQVWQTGACSAGDCRLPYVRCCYEPCGTHPVTQQVVEQGHLLSNADKLRGVRLQGAEPTSLRAVWQTAPQEAPAELQLPALICHCGTLQGSIIVEIRDVQNEMLIKLVGMNIVTSMVSQVSNRLWVSALFNGLRTSRACGSSPLPSQSMALSITPPGKQHLQGNDNTQNM